MGPTGTGCGSRNVLRWQILAGKALFDESGASPKALVVALPGFREPGGFGVSANGVITGSEVDIGGVDFSFDSFLEGPFADGISTGREPDEF